VADEPKPASQSLADRIKALTAKASAPAATTAAPATPDAAKAATPPVAAAPGAAASAGSARGSLAARIAAMTGKGPAAPSTSATPAAPATGAPAPAPAAPAKTADDAPAVGVVGASPLATTKRLSLSDRLKSLATGTVPPAGAVAASASAASAAAPAASASKVTPAKPVAATPPPKASTPPPAKPAAATAPEAPPKPAPRVTKPAPPPPPPAPEVEPWPDFPPNKYSQYVDDEVFELLPKDTQRIILEATNEEGVIPVRRFLRKLEEPERSAQEELVVGFMENLISTLKTRFFLDDEEPERKMFIEPSGDMTMRTGDGEVKVRAKCWEFFFLFRQKRWIGASKKDRKKALLGIFEECFNFQLADTSVCKMKVYETVDFSARQDAHYLEAQLDVGGWCELRFEAATVFTDGRVLVATFQPRVIRAKDVPAPKVMSPKEFAGLLASKRRR